ncbi:MAG: hypothetical protein SAK42_00925 [Oscillatoria sp. PMC 1076.18]|nr:hypothetical protein [Oscillatoria sp. PMC 1076.18]
MDNLQAERIESLKAGIISSLSFTFSQVVMIFFNNLWLADQDEFLFGQEILTEVDWLERIAIALVTGFLFGVTYRHLVRDEQNSHLQEGAVLAFGIVRGIALIEAQLPATTSIWLLSILVVQSILSFFLARLVLDKSLKWKIVKPLT